MSKNNKISLLFPNLRGGGAERLAVNLANDWVSRGFEVTFILVQQIGELLPALDPSITIINLDVDRIRNVIWPLCRFLKKNRQQVMWANMWPLTSVAVIAWLFAYRPGKLYLTDHNHLSISCVQELGISKPWLSLIMCATYRFASGVTAVSNGVAADMGRLTRLGAERIRVIYNPAATGVILNPCSPVNRAQLWGGIFCYHILAMGNLKKVKNFSLLLRAFVKISVTLNAKLTIVGEGNLRQALEQQITELDLQGRVSLPGFTVDPYPWFHSADLFVLSSDREGFGNVIVEALECGVPVVSTDCPSGPAEILDNGRYGRLVPVGDEGALAEAMLATLLETHDREALKQRAQDFSVERISNQYLDYFGLPRHA